METILTVKFVLFLALELFVVGTLGAVLVAGLVQVVRDRIGAQERLEDEVVMA